MSDFGPRQFATTRWTIVLKAKESDQSEGREALEQLCQSYWQPLYAFVRRKGYDSQQAADLTQGFFTHVLEKRVLEKSAPDRGRFRSFLLACIRNFLNNEFHRENAAKRGGDQTQFSLDISKAESSFELLSKEPSPELVFDKQWANSLISRVHQQLDESTKQRTDLHETLKSFLTREPAEGEYETIAQDFGMTVVAIRVAVFRLRERFRKLLRQEVSETLQEGDSIDDEINYLLDVLAN